MLAKLRHSLLLMTTLGVFCATGFALAVQADDSLAQDDLRSEVSTGAEKPTHPGPKEVRNNHGTTTDCAQCHGDQPESTTPDAAKLVIAVPQLCSTCHESYASLDGWVHGPVATGDCLFCHDPHESEYGSLLTKSLPELCHQCHTEETLGLIAGHSDESYGHCDTCHESHVATNRKLLKESFLGSAEGAVYAGAMTSRHRPYRLVDQRDSLAGLEGIRVIPAIERQDLIGRYGLSPEVVKKEVERCLRARGVPILLDEKPSTGQHGLHALLRLVELRFPGYSNGVCALSGSLDLSLQQTVELISQPDDAERRICLASTWDTSAVVVWGIPQIQEGLKDAIEVLVDRFCSDYLVAGSSDKQSLSGQGASEDPENRVNE